MLTSVTTLLTPAVLVRWSKARSFYTLTAAREYRAFHGYPPIPQTRSFRELFDKEATPEQSAFAVGFADPIACLADDGTFVVRVDLLSAEPATDATLRSLSGLAEKLFRGQFGEDIDAGAFMACGTGINCHDPSDIRAFRSSQEILIAQFHNEINQLLRLSDNASAEHRPDNHTMAWWLSCSLEQLLPAPRFAKFSSVLKLVETWKDCPPSKEDANHCRKLLEECLNHG
jgi:hypothetical protein